MEGIEVYNGPIEVSMGYTSSISVMLAEELALTNDVVGAISITMRGTVAQVAKLEETSLRIYMEMELTSRDLSISLLRAHLNTMAPMEVDLTTKVLGPPALWTHNNAQRRAGASAGRKSVASH
ncbi:hypothetical protein BDM02DRAFT_3193152 [Thelephora ganbajun]|uniref:Uncharacterized protein n=1 Tax=Thelephora ganbajun TaxID=370292 RepID=A0ACB6Z030_THEGA|nr:hypothetical protein BDM02DRAFT_3193152 [Thelephora ganbajun]